jgi:hypothetical protein
VAQKVIQLTNAKQSEPGLVSRWILSSNLLGLTALNPRDPIHHNKYLLKEIEAHLRSFENWGRYPSGMMTRDGIIPPSNDTPMHDTQLKIRAIWFVGDGERILQSSFLGA